MVLSAVVQSDVAIEGPGALVRRRLPHDPTEPIGGYRCSVMTGTTTWMPSEYADRPIVEMSRSGAWVILPGIGRRVELDLSALTLRTLTPINRWRSRSQGCTAVVVGPDGEFTIRGPWIVIAWLGHVACWPDPAR